MFKKCWISLRATKFRGKAQHQFDRGRGPSRLRSLVARSGQNGHFRLQDAQAVDLTYLLRQSSLVDWPGL